MQGLPAYFLFFSGICLHLPPIDGVLSRSSDDNVGISFLDCGKSSVLTELPPNQDELTLYVSTPEVRLEYPEEALRDIKENFNGSHSRYFRDRNLVIVDRPLYGETLMRGQLRDFSHIYKFQEEGVPLRCGGCIYQALVDHASSSIACPANITIDVPTGCVLTALHVDWIEPHDVMDNGYVKRSDVIREGNAPGDAFVPGVYNITYNPDGRSDFETCSFQVRINAFCQSSDLVRTIIGPMSFNRTLVGETANSTGLYCPDFGEEGFRANARSTNLPRATAHCIYDQDRGPIWREPADMTDCLQNRTIEERFSLIKMLLEQLLEKARNDDPLDRTEVIEVGLAIDAFSMVLSEDDDITSMTGDLLELLIMLNDSSDEVTNIVLSVVDNFYSTEETDGSNITQSLEHQAMNQILSGSNYTGVEENVALINVILKDSSEDNMVSLSFGNFKVDSSDPDAVALQSLDEADLRVTRERIDGPMDSVLTSVSLPTNIQSFIREDGQLAVSFLLYRGGSLFPTSRRPIGMLGPNTRQKVGSQVVAATVYNLSNINQNFSQNDQLVTTFTPLETIADDEAFLDDRICAFWNTSSGGFWSTEGCSIVPSTARTARIVCMCDHATNFAVLVNVQKQNVIFTWISQVGAAISSFALLATILSVLSIKKLRQTTPWRVHVSLMCALLGLYVFFLFGADQTGTRIICIVVTAAMHYFLLSSFVWMLMEGILLYKTIVNAKSIATLRYFTAQASFAAWVLPVLPVAAPIAMRYTVSGVEMDDFYELNNYCFLKPDSSVIFIGLIGIMASILAFNFIVLILIIRRLMAPNQATKDHRHQFFFTFVSITVLFGLTWIVGFFAIRDADFIVSIIFSALNGLQGFFLFLIFGVREKEVRQLWGSALVCGRDEKTRRVESLSNSTNSKKPKSNKSGTESFVEDSRSNSKHSGKSSSDP